MGVGGTMSCLFLILAGAMDPMFDDVRATHLNVSEISGRHGHHLHE